MIPTAALDPDGVGTTLTGLLVVTLKLFLLGNGFGVVTGFGFGLALRVGTERPS